MYDNFFDNIWQIAVKQAYEQALTRLNAIEIKAGEQTVVLGPGWGILLHEAVDMDLRVILIKKLQHFMVLLVKKLPLIKLPLLMTELYLIKEDH